MKTNVKSTALNKTLKNLETKKLIKSVTSVNASKKKVYMLFDLEPDRSITGGAWYSGKEFESEFVEILNEQCYHYLCEKRETSAVKFQTDSKLFNDPILKKNSAFVSSKEIRDYIKNLGKFETESLIQTQTFKPEKTKVSEPLPGKLAETLPESDTVQLFFLFSDFKNDI